MLLFHYTGKNKENISVESSIQANNKEEAIQKISQLGVTEISIQKETNIQDIDISDRFYFRGVTPEEKSVTGTIPKTGGVSKATHTLESQYKLHDITISETPFSPSETQTNTQQEVSQNIKTETPTHLQAESENKNKDTVKTHTRYSSILMFAHSTLGWFLFILGGYYLISGFLLDSGLSFVNFIKDSFYSPLFLGIGLFLFVLYLFTLIKIGYNKLSVVDQVNYVFILIFCIIIFSGTVMYQMNTKAFLGIFLVKLFYFPLFFSYLLSISSKFFK